MSNQSLADFYTPYGGGAETFFDIKAKLKDRLKEIGQIKTSAAYDLLRKDYNYHVIQRSFRSIMLEMIGEGKVKQLGRGIYWIIDDSGLIRTPRSTIQAEQDRKLAKAIEEIDEVLEPVKPAASRTWFSSVYKCEMSI